MQKRELINTFQKASDENAAFVFMSIQAEGTLEIICIPDISFKSKKDFYEQTYTEDCKHVMNKNVIIKSVDYGSSETLNAFF